MKKVIPIILLIIFITTISIFIYADKENAANKKVVKNSLTIEDRIIIKDLKIESDEPLLDVIPEEFNNNIIYDNSFEDTIVDYDKLNPEKPHERRKKLIRKLRKRNKRWHISKYKIRRNDNIWKIAKRFRISHKLIIKANDIRKINKIKPGKYLYIPNKKGFFYRIRRNDTLSRIAVRYKTSSRKILHHNKLRSKYLRVGKRIFIPDGKKRRYKRRYRRYNRYRGRYARRGIRLRWPLRGKITSGFGTRRDPFNGKRKFHCGVDISANIGTRIRAAASGRVIYSGWKPGYGRMVILRHKRGYITVYAHNSKNKVRYNQWVRKGQLIAYSGNTGATTGAHLHFELRKYITPLNPLRFIY